MANQTEPIQIGKGKGKNGRRTEKTYLDLENQYGRKGKVKAHPRTCQPTLRLSPSRPRRKG